MKRNLLLLTCSLLLLTGCNSTKTTSDIPSTEPIQNTTESTQEENLDFYIGQIVEFPVEINGIGGSVQSEIIVNLCMTEPNVIEINDTYLTAKGILTNEVFSTYDEVTVQYDFLEYEGVNLLSDAKCLSESDIVLTPGIPFTIDLLCDLAGSVLIFPEEGSSDCIEYPLPQDTFTIELSEDGWKNHFRYDGIITITDADGNVYQTINPYVINYSGKDFYNYQWGIPGSDDRIAVRPVK